MTKIITESDPRHYSIAIPFIDEENLLFQVRSDKLSHQPGDICFPGGTVEKEERSEEAVVRGDGGGIQMIVLNVTYKCKPDMREEFLEMIYNEGIDEASRAESRVYD